MAKRKPVKKIKIPKGKIKKTKNIARFSADVIKELIEQIRAI